MYSIAKETGFIKRKRELTPNGFLDAMMLGALSKDEETLKTHVIALNKDHGIQMRPQSFDEHINSESVEFIKSLIQNQLKTRLHSIVKTEGFLQKWDRVILHDATQFRLPNSLKSIFKGFGGNLKCDSIFKIQHAYDLKQGTIEELEVGDAKLQDATSGKAVMPRCGDSDLVIRDLGYFEIDSFKKAECDYLSRLKPKTAMFGEDGKKLDMKKLDAKMRKNKLAYLDIPVTIGIKKKVKTRAVIILVPEDVKKERIRKANKQNKSYGNKTSDEFKLYAGFNIYITNVSKDELSAKQIIALYRVRWQVELMFKSWKSYFKLNVFKECKPYRVLCYVYSSLLLILINWEIASTCMKLAYEQNGQHSSMLQTMKYQVIIRQEIRSWINGAFDDIAEGIKSYFMCVFEYIPLGRRKNRSNYVDILFEIDENQA